MEKTITEKQLRQIVREAVKQRYINEGVDEFGIPLPNIKNYYNGWKRNNAQKERDTTNNYGKGYTDKERGFGRTTNDVSGTDYGIGQLYDLDGKVIPNSDGEGGANPDLEVYNQRMANGLKTVTKEGVPQDFDPKLWKRLELYKDIAAKVYQYIARGYFTSREAKGYANRMIGACQVCSGTDAKVLIIKWRKWKKANPGISWGQKNYKMVSEGWKDYFRNTTNNYGVQMGHHDNKQGFFGRVFAPRTEKPYEEGGNFGTWAGELKKEIENAMRLGCFSKDKKMEQQAVQFVTSLCNSYHIPLGPFAAIATALGFGGSHAPSPTPTVDSTPTAQVQTINEPRGRGQAQISNTTVKDIIQQAKQDQGMLIVVTPHSSAVKQNQGYDNNALENKNFEIVKQQLMNAGIPEEQIQRGNDNYTQIGGYGTAEMENNTIQLVPSTHYSNPNALRNSMPSYGTFNMGSGNGATANPWALNESKLKKIIRKNIRKALNENRY